MMREFSCFERTPAFVLLRIRFAALSAACLPLASDSARLTAGSEALRPKGGCGCEAERARCRTDSDGISWLLKTAPPPFRTTALRRWRGPKPPGCAPETGQSYGCLSLGNAVTARNNFYAAKRRHPPNSTLCCLLCAFPSINGFSDRSRAVRFTEGSHIGSNQVDAFPTAIVQP